MSSGVEAIFNQIPVDESATANEEVKESKNDFKKDHGDRVKKGSVNDRIAAFGDLVDEDDYGQDDKKGFEPVKVEKDKTPVSQEKPEIKDEKREEKREDKVKPLEEKQVIVEKRKVKVDGVEEEVSFDDALKSYSSQKANAKRFTELDKEKKAFEKVKLQNENDTKYIQKEVGDLRSGFETIISEYKKNGFLTKSPMQVVDNLLDKMGINSHDFNKALFEHNLQEYANFFGMDEAQQDSYFAKKENEYLRKKDQTFAERTSQAQAHQAREKEEFNLIKNAGLTVETYNSLFDELESLGDEDISTAKIIEFSKVKPVMDKAGEILSKTSMKGDVSLLNKVTNLLLQFPSTTEEEIIAEIDGSEAVKRAAKILKDKEDFTIKSNLKSKKNFTEEDTDFDMELFKSIRRR